MATRVEKRSLYDRVTALRSNVYRLLRVADFGGLDLHRQADIARFHSYLRQTKALAKLAHRWNPSDIVWRERREGDIYYAARNVQEHLEKVEEYVDRSFGGRPKGRRIALHAGAGGGFAG